MKNIFLSFLGIAFLLAGCGDGPDLIPVQISPAYCNIEDGKLIVTVKNIGNENAIESVTLVDFGNLGSRTVPLKSLAPNEQVSLSPIDLPDGCFNPDCGFRITVDALNDVSEKTESNNDAVGNCVG